MATNAESARKFNTGIGVTLLIFGFFLFIGAAFIAIQGLKPVEPPPVVSLATPEACVEILSKLGFTAKQDGTKVIANIPGLDDPQGAFLRASAGITGCRIPLEGLCVGPACGSEGLSMVLDTVAPIPEAPPAPTPAG
jgi:hypothetical protein